MRSASPVRDLTRATNSVALVASRTALVATATTRSASSFLASIAMLLSASTARVIAASSSRPVASRPVPSRGAAFISSTTVIVPSGSTSATICRIEFDPTSMAAIRTAPDARRSVERRSPSRRSASATDVSGSRVAIMVLKKVQNAAQRESPAPVRHCDVKFAQVSRPAVRYSHAGCPALPVDPARRDGSVLLVSADRPWLASATAFMVAATRSVATAETATEAIDNAMAHPP